MRSHCIYKEELWNWKYLHVRSQERCTGRDTCEFPRATVPESDSNFIRRNCEIQSTYMWEVKKDVLEEMPVNFQELLCQNQTVTVEGGIAKLKVLTCEKSRKKILEEILVKFWQNFPQNVAENAQKTWFTFDAVLVQFWNYIKSASYFLDISTLFSKKNCWKSSKNMMHFRCSFDAVLMQFWNCIKSASKPLETTSKVHQNDIVSKLHQNCIKSAS